MGVVCPLWAEPRPKNMFLGDSRFQVASSPLGFVESDRGFGIWLAQWHLHSPTELDFSFSCQGHKVTNLENVKKINKLGIELLGFSTVSNESWYASSALRVLQLSSFTFFPIPASLPVASPRRSKNKKGEPCTLLVNHRRLQTCVYL